MLNPLYSNTTLGPQLVFVAPCQTSLQMTLLQPSYFAPSTYPHLPYLVRQPFYQPLQYPQVLYSSYQQYQYQQYQYPPQYSQPQYPQPPQYLSYQPQSQYQPQNPAMIAVQYVNNSSSSIHLPVDEISHKATKFISQNNNQLPSVAMFYKPIYHDGGKLVFEPDYASIDQNAKTFPPQYLPGFYVVDSLTKRPTKIQMKNLNFVPLTPSQQMVHTPEAIVTSPSSLLRSNYSGSPTILYPDSVLKSSTQPLAGQMSQSRIQSSEAPTTLNEQKDYKQIQQLLKNIVDPYRYRYRYSDSDDGSDLELIVEGDQSKFVFMQNKAISREYTVENLMKKPEFEKYGHQLGAILSRTPSSSSIICTQTTPLSTQITAAPYNSLDDENKIDEFLKWLKSSQSNPVYNHTEVIHGTLQLKLNGNEPKFAFIQQNGAVSREYLVKDFMRKPGFETHISQLQNILIASEKYDVRGDSGSQVVSKKTKKSSDKQPTSQEQQEQALSLFKKHLLSRVMENEKAIELFANNKNGEVMVRGIRLCKAKNDLSGGRFIITASRGAEKYAIFLDKLLGENPELKEKVDEKKEKLAASPSTVARNASTSQQSEENIARV